MTPRAAIPAILTAAVLTACGHPAPARPAIPCEPASQVTRDAALIQAYLHDAANAATPAKALAWDRKAEKLSAAMSADTRPVC